MQVCELTEQDIIDKLVEVSKNNDEDAPRAFVHKRFQAKKNSITRTVNFVLITSTDNTVLIDALVRETMDIEGFSFTGSEVNLQGDLKIQYLYFEASIMAKK